MLFRILKFIACSIMLEDLKLFDYRSELKIFTRDNIRAVVYLEKIEDLDKISQLRCSFAKVTLLSTFPIVADVDGAIFNSSKKIGYKEVPYDRLVYEALGKGLKEYEYYVTSLLFINGSNFVNLVP